MAVVYVTELFEGRTGGDNLERKRSYVRVFEVRTDDPEDDATVAGGTDLLPRNGDPHPNDEFAVMVAIEPAQSSQDNTLWQVTCRYSSDFPEDQQREALGYDSSGQPVENPGSSTGGTGGGGGGESMTRETDPRSRPARWSGTWEQTTEVLRTDVAGVAIKNSAGDPFDPPPTVERNYLVLTIEKNISCDSAFLRRSNQRDYQEAVNSDRPWGYDEMTLKVARVEFKSEIENGIAYVAASLSIKFKPEGWLMKLVDAGFRNSAGNFFGKDPVTGALPSDPKPLDGAGAALALGQPLHLLEFQVCRPIAFIPMLALLGVSAA